MSLSHICPHVLERFLPKDDSAWLSDWSVIGLSDTQKKYAALDTWTGLQIYQKLKQNEILGKRISKPVKECIYLQYFIFKYS